MAQEYKGQNPLDIAKKAEKDMNSLENRTGAGKTSDSGKCVFIKNRTGSRGRNSTSYMRTRRSLRLERMLADFQEKPSSPVSTKLALKNSLAAA